MKKFAKMAVAAAIAGLSMAAQAQLLIDDFSTGQPTISDTGAVDGIGFASSVACGVSCIGGNRDLYIEKLAGPGAAGVHVGVEAAAPGFLAYSQDAVQNGFGIVRWDGGGSVPVGAMDRTAFDLTRDFAGGLNANLSAAGTAFQLTVLGSDLGFPFTIRVFTTLGNYSEFISTANAGAATYLINFGGFTSVGSGADFGSVDVIEAIFNTPNGIEAADFALDIVRVVPEPGSLALTGLAVLALGAVRRRKAV